MNYYNENDPHAAAWLRELIKAGEIPPGDVDDRSIEEVKPHEIAKYTQHHFFAGIGGWALALRLAGWPDDRPARTASCPCQPFSQTGKQLGFADKRHLWPVCRDLLTFGDATITFGEQVASPLGREWLARVRTDMEGLGYEVGAADLCAAGVRSPHLRQRLYWVANRIHRRQQNRRSKNNGKDLQINTGRHTYSDIRTEVAQHRSVGGLVQPNSTGRQSWEFITAPAGHGNSTQPASNLNRLGGTNSAGPQGRDERIFRCDHQWPVGTPNLVVLCEDGKARRFEPRSFPLAHGVPGRVGLLRGYGNAIVPQLAAEFICAAREAIQGVK